MLHRGYPCAITSTMIIILANTYEVCSGRSQCGEHEDDGDLVLYATSLFNTFKGQSTLVSFQRLDAVITELNDAVRLAKRTREDKTSADITRAVTQPSNTSGDPDEDMFPGEVSFGEVFSHEVVQWGGEDGSELDHVFASVFGMGGEELGEEASWMDSEQNYIFKGVDFDEVVSGFGFSASY